MRLAQLGDRVLVHYVKRFEDDTLIASRSRGDPPLELTVGTAHPRLPGLDTGLVGLAPGKGISLLVPAAEAYGVPDPQRIRRVARARFLEGRPLLAGRRARLLDRRGRLRVVRVVKVRGKVIVVDANHPRAGQRLEMEVELIAILTPDAPAAPAPPRSPERSPACNR